MTYRGTESSNWMAFTGYKNRSSRHSERSEESQLGRARLETLATSIVRLLIETKQRPP